jgi:hypothetical protein
MASVIIYAHRCQVYGGCGVSGTGRDVFFGLLIVACVIAVAALVGLIRSW